MSRYLKTTGLFLALAFQGGISGGNRADAFFGWLCPSRNCGTQTSYRTVMMPVPVTTFQPIQTGGTTCMQPCSTTQWQAQRVPVQTFLAMPSWSTTVAPVSAPQTCASPVAPAWSTMSPAVSAAPACGCGTCPSCAFTPATTTASPWQPVSWNSFGGSSAACPTGSCAASSVGYATASEFAAPAAAPACNCGASPSASSVGSVTSTISPSTGTTTTPWESATPSQYEQWQQQQRGQQPESEKRPDLDLTPVPSSSDGISASSSQTSLSPSPDWRPLQATSQPGPAIATPAYRPIPDPQSIRPAGNGSQRPRIERKKSDGLLDRGSLHTASRSYQAVPIRWERTAQLADSSEEGNWHSVSP